MPRQMGIVYRRGGHVSWPIRRIGVESAKKAISKGGTLAVFKENGHAEVWDEEGFCIGYLTRAQVEKLHSSNG